MPAVQPASNPISLQNMKSPDYEDEIALDSDVLALLLRWKEECPEFCRAMVLSKPGYRQACPR